MTTNIPGSMCSRLMTVQLAGAHPVPMPESQLGDGLPTISSLQLLTRLNTRSHSYHQPASYVSYSEYSDVQTEGFAYYNGTHSLGLCLNKVNLWSNILIYMYWHTEDYHVPQPSKFRAPIQSAPINLKKEKQLLCIYYQVNTETQTGDPESVALLLM